MEDVYIEMKQDVLERVFEQRLGDVTLIDLLMGAKQVNSEYAEFQLELLTELTNEVRTLSDRVKELNSTLYEVNRRQIIKERHGGHDDDDFDDTFRFP